MATYLIVITQAGTVVNKYIPFLYIDTCTFIKTKLKNMCKAMFFILLKVDKTLKVIKLNY